MKLSSVGHVYQDGYARMGKLLSYNRRLRHVLEIAERRIPKQAQRFLDVGCGDGVFTQRLGEIFGAPDVYGVDVSAVAAREAKGFGIKATALDLDVQDLPYPAKHFDVVFCGSLIELVLDPDHLVEELYRVLKPGGHLLITYPNHCAWLSRISVLLGYNPYYDRLSRRYNIGKLYAPPIRTDPGNSTGFIRLYSTNAFR